MSSSRSSTSRTEPPRLFLITPPIAEAERFRPLLEAAMGAADIACVLVRTATHDDGGAKTIVKALASIIQDAGAALLVSLDHRIAARVDADGVHVLGAGPALDEAIDALQPKKIVGVGALVGRDAAMLAGESGADYVMFGGPDDPEDADSVEERASWWAEIFNVPCVAYAHHPDRALALARTGAEFVALCDGVWDEPASIADTIRAVARALAESTPKEATLDETAP